MRSVVGFQQVDDQFWASKRVGFGWEKQVTVRGGCGSGGRAMGEPVASSRWRRVADGGDARRRPLVADERKRESEERVREREKRLGESGLPCPTSTPLPFCSISLFF